MPRKSKGLQAILYAAIQTYAKEVAKTPDRLRSGNLSVLLAGCGRRWQACQERQGQCRWLQQVDARLLKAAYNYQVSVKDPGAFAHNAKYIIELLYDSIEDLNGKISKPVDMTKLARD